MRALWNARYLLRELVRRELGSRVVGSAGGWVWLVGRPVLFALVYYFVFEMVFQVRLGRDTTDLGFGVYMLSGLLPWMALNEGVVTGTSSLINSAGLMKKTALPLELFPARSVLALAVIYAPLVYLFGLGVMASRGALDWALLLPLWLALQVLMTYFLALSLALLAAALRDVVQLVTLVTSVWLFLSPVIIPMERVPNALKLLLWLNPGTPLVLGYHDLILHGHLPDGAAWLGVLAWILALMLFARMLLGRVREQVIDWL